MALLTSVNVSDALIQQTTAIGLCVLLHISMVAMGMLSITTRMPEKVSPALAVVLSHMRKHL